MFTFTRHIGTASLPGYMHQLQVGICNPLPDLHCCLVEFDTTLFDPDAFQQAGIPLPAQLQHASAKRQAEYLAARYCAMTLLRETGNPQTVLPWQREAPIWPAGWCGSLSHTQQRAIAIMAPQSAGLLPGVDIEITDVTRLPELASMFASPEEQVILHRTSLPFQQGLLLLFSAKESLYKSLWPQLQRFIDFSAATLCTLSPDSQQLCLRLPEALSATLPRDTRFTIYFQFEAGGVITCVG